MGDMDGMTFTPALYGIQGRAAEIARAAGSEVVEAEHLMLAMVHDGRSLPAQVVDRLAGLDVVEARVSDLMSRPDYSPVPREYRYGLPVARWMGARTAAAMGRRHIGVQHVFLEIIRDRDTIPAQVLDDLGCRDEIDAEVVRRATAPSVVPSDAVFLPSGCDLDDQLLEAILGGLPDVTKFGMNWTEDRRQWILIRDGDTREVVNAALAGLGRAPIA
jgi:ATP-dependent Clp protease ATP-binding subunit ClpA